MSPTRRPFQKRLPEHRRRLRSAAGTLRRNPSPEVECACRRQRRDGQAKDRFTAGASGCASSSVADTVGPALPHLRAPSLTLSVWDFAVAQNGHADRCPNVLLPTLTDPDQRVSSTRHPPKLKDGRSPVFRPRLLARDLRAHPWINAASGFWQAPSASATSL